MVTRYVMSRAELERRAEWYEDRGFRAALGHGPARDSLRRVGRLYAAAARLRAAASDLLMAEVEALRDASGLPSTTFRAYRGLRGGA